MKRRKRKNTSFSVQNNIRMCIEKFTADCSRTPLFKQYLLFETNMKCHLKRSSRSDFSMIFRPLTAIECDSWPVWWSWCIGIIVVDVLAKDWWWSWFIFIIGVVFGIGAWWCSWWLWSMFKSEIVIRKTKRSRQVTIRISWGRASI